MRGSPQLFQTTLSTVEPTDRNSVIPHAWCIKYVHRTANYTYERCCVVVRGHAAVMSADMTASLPPD